MHQKALFGAMNGVEPLCTLAVEIIRPFFSVKANIDLVYKTTTKKQLNPHNSVTKVQPHKQN